MKVCMVAYSFYESDSRIIQYAQALVRRGDSVDVIALSHDGAPHFEMVEGVQVYRVQRREINERAALGYLCRIMRFLLVSMMTLTWKHLRKHYDLVHVHSVPDFLVFAALPLRLMGVPVILDIHDILPEFYSSKFAAGQDSLTYRVMLLVEKCSAKLASYVIIANHLWYERLVGRSVEKNKCSAICNYPNLQIFYPRIKDKNREGFLMMYPGSLNWHQGVDIAIHAFAKVHADLEGAKFHVYGEGAMRPALEKLVHDLGLEREVTIENYRPTEEIAALMAAADLSVVPKRASSSFGNEAASTKVQEFMAVGVPVIVSRTKVDSYYFNDSMVKFFESDDVDALAAAILDLYRNPEERQRLIEHAFDHIRRNNWDVKQGEYLHIVDQLTTTKQAPVTESNVSEVSN